MLRCTQWEGAGTIHTKICRLCKEEKKIENYYSSKAFTRDGLRHECKKCTARQNLERRLRNLPSYKEVQRKRHFLSNYGLTLEQLEALKEKQEFACLICKRKDLPLVVDHDHSTGKVRGLLCSYCNQGLGSFFENGEALREAVKYLEKYNAKEL